MAPKNAFSSFPAITYLYWQALVYTAAFRLNRQWLSPQNTLSVGTENMQSSIFLVNDEPFCVWEPDLKETCKRFLKRLDPDFFE